MPPRILLLLAGLLTGCGGAAPGDPPVLPAPADECRVDAGPDGRPAGPDPAVLLAAAGAGDTMLLSPVRARTPIGVTCTGRPVPRAASAWSADSSGRSWTLVVPAAPALAGVWRSRAAAAAALRLGGVTEVVPLDQNRVVVTFERPQEAVPSLFADLALAEPDAGGSSAIRVLPPPADLRDAVDQGADLVVTGDPDVLDYGVARGYVRYELPWSRAYVLLVPAGSAVSLPPDDDAGSFRDDLARDAVRAAARPAMAPFWWDTVAGCIRPSAPPVSASRAVVYPEDDRVARALAERIVAVARPSGIARGVPGGDLAAAMGRGAGAAYVVPLPRAPTVPCREVAPWPAGASVIPLIETRLTALLRRGAPSLLVDLDGGLRPAAPR